MKLENFSSFLTAAIVVAVTPLSAITQAAIYKLNLDRCPAFNESVCTDLPEFPNHTNPQPIQDPSITTINSGGQSFIGQAVRDDAL